MTHPHQPKFDHLVSRLHVLDAVPFATKETKDAVRVALDQHKDVLAAIAEAGGAVTPRLRDSVAGMGEAMCAVLRSIDVSDADLSNAGNSAWNAFGQIVVATTGG